MSSKVWLAITAIATAFAAGAAMIAAWHAYRSLELQERLTLPSASTIEVAGMDSSVDCPSVNQHGTQVQGVAKMQRSEKLWTVLSAPGQGVIYLPSGSPTEMDDGRWSQAIPYIGDDGSSGDHFEVLAVAADANASALLSRTANGSDEAPHVQALPGGS